MTWNPHPKVADCRDIAQKWGGKEQIIILAIDGEGRMEIVTYGHTPKLCACAQKLGEIAFSAVSSFIAKLF